MGLSNSQRELLLNNININNYVNDMIPVSEQIVFSSTDVIHERTIEENPELKEYDVKYVDYSKVNDELPPSPDISEEQIDIPVPLLTKPEITEEDEEYIDDEVEEIMEYDSKESVKEPVNKEPNKSTDKPPVKPVDKPDHKQDSLDTDFFMAMTNIESKKEDVKQTHKSNSPHMIEQPGGGANIKKIQLTEKYDFF